MVPSDVAPLRESWPAGLDLANVARRRAAGQVNRGRMPGSTSLARILRRNVFTILNGTLFGVALLLLPFGRYLDAAFTALPVAANVLTAVVLELRAKLQLERLRLIHRPQVTVRRGGADQLIPAQDVVLGDVLVLGRGDQAIVDGRVLAGSVEMDESVLTGESVPVVRRTGDPILSGSDVVAGRAAVEATAVGGATFASRLTAQARSGRDERTPLRRDLDSLILVIGIITLIVALPVFLSFLLAGESLLDDEIVRAAAVLVAFVPQGLAIMVTVTYAVAAVRVSRAGAIIQRIDAAESMSRIDVLCLDKTGTITSSTLVLELLQAADPAANGDALRRRVGRAAASTQHVDRTMAALAAGLPAERGAVAREVAFSSTRRWSAIAMADEPMALVFAAPDALPAATLGGLADTARELAEDGQRVLAVMEVAPELLGDADDGLPDGQVLALLGLAEEIRPDARATLAELRARGVRPKIVSGDDPRTAAAIGRRAGVEVRRVISGAELAAGSGSLPERVAEVDVFGRVSPQDKPRIVDALRERGHVVGMVGDGVNDVLALRRANVGIAMESGSAAARAVAGMVLLGDRFAILPYAITEGQRVVSAMIAVACILLARTVYMLVLVAIATLAGLPFPFTPTSNAVLAMVTVGIPILVIALWVPPVRSPPSVVRRVLRFAVPAGLAVSLLVVPIMIGAFALADVETGRSIVTTATVFAGIALIPILFPPVRDRASPVGPGGDVRPALMAGAMLLLYGAIMAVPPVRDVYDLVALPIELLVGLALATVAWAGVVIALIRLGVARRLVGALDR
jgi:cation-transporting P-type ATPase E